MEAVRDVFVPLVLHLAVLMNFLNAYGVSSFVFYVAFGCVYLRNYHSLHDHLLLCYSYMTSNIDLVLHLLQKKLTAARPLQVDLSHHFQEPQYQHFVVLLHRKLPSFQLSRRWTNYCCIHSGTLNYHKNEILCHSLLHLLFSTSNQPCQFPTHDLDLQEHILCRDENDSVVPCGLAMLIHIVLLQMMEDPLLRRVVRIESVNATPPNLIGLVATFSYEYHPCDARFVFVVFVCHGCDDAVCDVCGHHHYLMSRMIVMNHPFAATVINNNREPFCTHT
mmetsp:Transcript_17944/g.27328  ORF Transcript_17944/g.27328 Transcript_17944/m.27328 type:complete len:277 (+) Transcript_17944:301-1131(+)